MKRGKKGLRNAVLKKLIYSCLAIPLLAACGEVEISCIDRETKKEETYIGQEWQAVGRKIFFAKYCGPDPDFVPSPEIVPPPFPPPNVTLTFEEWVSWPYKPGTRTLQDAALGY